MQRPSHDPSLQGLSFDRDLGEEVKGQRVQFSKSDSKKLGKETISGK